MNKEIIKIHSARELNVNWDKFAVFYFQKREFLEHLEMYNPCEQRYYELYHEDVFKAGAIVYTLRIHLFTFSGISSPIKMKVIGIPVSVATEPLIGDKEKFESLLSEILEREKGIIAGLNFTQDHINGRTLNMRTLPTIVIKQDIQSMQDFEGALRHSYRRRVRRIREKFEGVSSSTTSCSEFNEEHYALYLQIMKRTKTKLETLSLDSFKYLPENFFLTTYYHANRMLCWHIVCKDKRSVFFYFGGMNYALRDEFQSYYNNLLGIVSGALEDGYTEVDLGQTAEIAKLRLGGIASERRMFIFHRNPLIFLIFRLFRNLINYKGNSPEHHVFKSDPVINNEKGL